MNPKLYEGVVDSIHWMEEHLEEHPELLPMLSKLTRLCAEQAPRHRRGPFAVSLDVDGREVACADGRVATCVGAIADRSIPHALWAADVLNRYGHLVP